MMNKLITDVTGKGLFAIVIRPQGRTPFAFGFARTVEARDTLRRKLEAGAL